MNFEFVYIYKIQFSGKYIQMTKPKSYCIVNKECRNWVKEEKNKEGLKK